MWQASATWRTCSTRRGSRRWQAVHTATRAQRTATNRPAISDDDEVDLEQSVVTSMQTPDPGCCRDPASGRPAIDRKLAVAKSPSGGDLLGLLGLEADVVSERFELSDEASG